MSNSICIVISAGEWQLNILIVYRYLMPVMYCAGIHGHDILDGTLYFLYIFR